jgi:prepilin-type N-terminal cleavage/methylation domain-containing protein
MKMPRHPRHKVEHTTPLHQATLGVTLIELLVVIAIIAIIAALLLPTLKRRWRQRCPWKPSIFSIETPISRI